MNILVFTKRVAATQEEELRITGEGQGVDLSKVPFKINDWDNYAVEEAVRIVEKSIKRLAQIGYRVIRAETIGLDIQLDAARNEQAISIRGYGVV